MSVTLRRLLPWLALVTVVGAFLVAVRQPEPAPRRDPGPPADLGAEVRRFAAGLDADAPYRPPEPEERRQLVSALHELRAGDAERATELAAALGFTVRTGVDAATGRPFGLAVNPAGDRAWGWYLVDLSAPTRLVVEVPHPKADLRTEEIGLALYRELPGSLLAVSGTHRRVGSGAGDVAHRADSMFHAVVTDLAARGLPQLQLHGYADDSLPDADVVISPGAGDAGDSVRRLADRIDDPVDGADLDVCRSWSSDCGGLEGTRNEQGRDAAERGTVFAHVELNRGVREDRDAWPALVRAMGRADLAG
jgi:hypothetical protein